MTLPTPWSRREGILELLACCGQLDEWRRVLERLAADGRRLVVGHGKDRRVEAARLAHRYSATTTSLHGLQPLQLRRGDLLILVSSTRRTSRPLLAVNELTGDLHGLVQRGVIIWGITGPRPNRLSPFCHDSVAVPEGEPSRLLRCHRLVVRRLVQDDPGPTSLLHRGGSTT